MAAPVVDLCNAIVGHIQSQTYSKTFNVERRNYVSTDLADTAKTNVYVYPGQPLASSANIYDRERFTRRYMIAVHFTNFVDDADEQAEIDDALLVVHEIEQSLENVHFGEFQMMSFTSEGGGRDFFAIDAQQERNYFHAIINVEYEGVV